MENSLQITTKSKLIAFITDANTYQYKDLAFDYDILALKFSEDVKSSKDQLKKIFQIIKKPLMICGCGNDEIDIELLPELIKTLDRKCIISHVTEKTYKEIIPFVISGGHYVILKTPIDINLAKELNILVQELGLPSDKIIINTDIGGLGYGYEYGYSMIEKVKIEREKDPYLDYPIFSDASSEALKTKEAKFDTFDSCWGIFEDRKRMIELSACAGVIAAGANIIAVNCPDNIKVLREIF